MLRTRDRWPRLSVTSRVSTCTGEVVAAGLQRHRGEEVWKEADQLSGRASWLASVPALSRGCSAASCSHSAATRHRRLRFWARCDVPVDQRVSCYTCGDCRGVWLCLFRPLRISLCATQRKNTPQQRPGRGRRRTSVASLLCVTRRCPALPCRASRSQRSAYSAERAESSGAEGRGEDRSDGAARHWHRVARCASLPAAPCISECSAADSAAGTVGRRPATLPTGNSAHS